MRTRTLVARNLVYYWRTNLAVMLGVATAVAVLTGALVVGDSVRASLRDLVSSVSEKLKPWFRAHSCSVSNWPAKFLDLLR